VVTHKLKICCINTSFFATYLKAFCGLTKRLTLRFINYQLSPAENNFYLSHSGHFWRHSSSSTCGNIFEECKSADLGAGLGSLERLVCWANICHVLRRNSCVPLKKERAILA